MRSRNAISVYVVGIVVISILSGMQTMYAEGKDGFFGGGDGTTGDPYVIEDVWDLQNMIDDLDAHYVLAGDIDASVTAGWNSGAGFTPVGSSVTGFTGNLDGRDHNISKLFIGRRGTSEVGLIGYLGVGGKVTDIRLERSDVTGRNDVGGLVGHCQQGTVSGSYYDGKSTGLGMYVGGLVGINEEGDVLDSYSTGSVSGSSFYVGGLVGASTGTVARCNSTAKVIGGGYMNGGLIGYNVGIVEDSRATGVVIGQHFTGGLIGDNRGTVSNSHAMGDVDATVDVGGLVGQNHRGTVKSSSSSGNVTGETRIGGLIGVNYIATVFSSNATGDVTGTEDVGGLVGRSDDVVYGSCATGHVTGTENVGGLVGFNSGEVSISLAKGRVSGGSSVGGLAGRNAGLVTRSGAEGDVYGTGDCVGGLVGADNSGEINGSHSSGNVTGHGYVGGLVGDAGFDGGFYCSLVNSHYDVDSVMINGGHYITLGGLFHSQYSDWASNGYRLDIADYSLSLIPSMGAYEIGTIQGLRDLLGFASIEDISFCLSADIDLSTAPGLWIPHLKASFDGTGHKISNLRLDLPFAAYVGLFGVNEGGTVDDVGVFDIDVRGRVFVGGLVGINLGRVNHSFVTGSVTGELDSVGGLVGRNGKYIVSDSHVNVNVRGSGDHVGGLIGVNAWGDVRVSHATGTVTGLKDVGGLVGISWGDISGSSAGTMVSGSSGVGGLVGTNEYGGAISSSFAIGDVTGTGNYIGGLVGNNYFSISRSYATGTVKGTVAVGGLAGQVKKGEVNESYSTGNVSGTRHVGGLVGYSSGSVLTDSYAIGNATGIENVGGILGYDGGSTIVTGCFWDVESSGMSTSVGGLGMTTVQMKSRDTFIDAGWDLTTTWFIVEDITYPLLRWQDKEPPRANAGEDQTVGEGTMVTFDGSASADDHWISNFTWTFHDGNPVTLYGISPSYIFDCPGIYFVELNVTDVLGNWDTDDMIVTVIDVSRPSADAGSDQKVDEGTVVTLDGSGSIDNIEIVNWTWTFLYGSTGFPYGDGQITLYGESSQFLFNAPGIYTVELTVRDAAGNSDSDNLIVTVIDIRPPYVDAGPDKIVDEGALVEFNESKCSDTGGIADYTWTFVIGNRELVISEQWPTFIFDMPGRYIVSLKVTDRAGHWSTDTVNVTVNDVTLPVANAGPDQTVDEGALITLDGSGSSDNVGIVNYTWSIIYEEETVELYGASVSFTSTVPNVYLVVLRVSDAAGHTGEDAMTLTVRDVTAPMADAGQDRTVPVGSPVSLNGSTSVDNVGIMSHTWTFTYDRQPRVLEGAVVQFTFEVGGVYEIVLNVTDGSGNRGTDTVVITVVDTGRVYGTVLDEEGSPVGGATVEVTASNGRSYTTTTTVNGSFALVIYHGLFIYNISKEGYTTLSGSASVGTMNVTELDLSDQPMVRENEDGPSDNSMLVPVVAVCLVIVGLVLLVLMSRGKGRPEGTT